MSRRHPMLVGGLLMLGLALRLAWLRDHQQTPLFEGLQLDQANYDAWARRIASGDVLGEGVFTSNPLAPYMLGLIYAALGEDLLRARVVQVLVDIGTCALLYGIALRLFGRGPATWTLALAACYGPLIHGSTSLVAEVWTIALVSGAMLLLAASSPHPLGLLLAGALLGLGALGRPNLLLLAPLLPLALELAHPARTSVRAARIGAWLLGLALVLGPVAARNLAVGGEAVLVTAHGGVNLWIGNNPDASGFFRTPPGSGLAGGQESLVASSIAVAEEAVGRPLDASEASRWWADRALAFALDDPLAFAGLMATKLRWYLNAYEAPLESSYTWAQGQSAALRWCTVDFGLVLPLALVGIVGRSRERVLPLGHPPPAPGAGPAWRRRLVPDAYLLTYTASVIVAFVAGRYRLPVVVVLLPYAGLGLATLWDLGAARAWRPMVGRLGVLAAGLLIAHLPLPEGKRSEDLAYAEFQVGNVLLDRGEAAEAARHLEEAVRLHPSQTLFHNNLGLALIRAGRPADAAEALEEGLARGAQGYKILRNLAAARLALGQRELAVDAYRRALERAPGHARTWRDLGEVLEDLGRAEEARAAYARAQERGRSRP